MEIIANTFVLNNCVFRPFRRLGIDTDEFAVQTERGRHIGRYSPSNNTLYIDSSVWLYDISLSLRESIEEVDTID